MFLRSLHIRGFKSFADKTVLEFAPGVSVIVGPNGSGKSNLVDAISWVLGEQGPRALRGGQMADVIFAGSPQRSALGMAEVKLVIDNSAGLIPVPMTEIEISRTIFRSGESEYRIGGQVVRLLDVQELLSETGIGRALHTVVGQGQLEDVLTARPEDRRTYIEEAAGVAKHRKRKERAERKLAGLDQDVLRLQDVLAELKRQLKPLRQQAEMAKRHETLTAEADTVAVRLAAARLRDLWDERERRKEGWDEGVARRTSARERLDALDGRVAAAADERARSVWALAGGRGGVRRGAVGQVRGRARAPARGRARVRGPAGGGRRDQPRRAALGARGGPATARGAVRRDGGRARGPSARARGGGGGVRVGRGRPARRRGRAPAPRRGGGGTPRRDGDVPPFARVARSRAFAVGGVARAGPGAPDDRRGGAGGARDRRRTPRRVHGAARRSPVRAGARAARAGRHGRGARGGAAPARAATRRPAGAAGRPRAHPRLPLPRGARGSWRRAPRPADPRGRRLGPRRCGPVSARSPTPSCTRTRIARWPTPRRARARRWPWRAAGPPRSSSRASGPCSRSSTRTRRSAASRRPC